MNKNLYTIVISTRVQSMHTSHGGVYFYFRPATQMIYAESHEEAVKGVIEAFNGSMTDVAAFEKCTWGDE